jgi:hypothetical protein
MPFSKQNRRWFLGLTLTCVGLFAPSRDGIQAVAADPVTAKNLKQKIISAKTAADHKAIAAYYRVEASKAKVKVTEHQEMAEAYRKTGFGTVAKTPNAPGTIEHCDHLITIYKDLADSLTAMAKEHEAMAANIK